MKILIIGSKGFIGKYCIKYFEKQSNMTVYGCDVMVDYISKNYYLIDASNSDYNRLFQSIAFDVCVNCSGAASVPNSIKNPSRDYQLNTVNVFKILDAIRQFAPKCKFINLSSAAVYGNPESLPVKENQKISPLSPYGYHKWQSEIISQSMTEQFGLKTTVLRIFSAYGEGLYKQLFWDLWQKSKQSNIVELFGTGEESRDFIHVIDIVQIIHLVIKFGSFDNDIINVANGKEVYIKNVVSLFYNLLNEKTTYKFKGSRRKGDPSNWVADITKLKNLGYNQTIFLKNGLSKYIKWAEKEK